MYQASGVCGQVPPRLTKQLENILREYSGKQLLNELLQNADDAEATIFAVCLDKRCHGTTSLISPKLADFQGPAILQFDNKNFKESDYESIQRLGDGLKKGDPTKTGQFGLGFNSCYHVTDLPSFISGNHLVILDPHSKYLPTPEVTGLYYQLDPNNANPLIQSYADQMSPYLNAFGCNGMGQWLLRNNPTNLSREGTLFRFPIRNATTAKSSKIKASRSPPTLESIYKEIFEPFIEDLPSRLLFLKHIQKIEVYMWEVNDPEMKLVIQSEVANCTPSVMLARRSQLTMIKENIEKVSGQIPRSVDNEYNESVVGNDVDTSHRWNVHIAAQEAIFKSRINIPRPCYSLWISTFSFVYQENSWFTMRQPSSNGLQLIHGMDHYLVSLGYGDAHDLSFIKSEAVRESTLFFVPYAGVAAKISQHKRSLFIDANKLQASRITGNATDAIIREITSGHPLVHESSIISRITPFIVQHGSASGSPSFGKLFCCLPSSISSELPVHIDARWELTRDRNHLAGYMPTSAAVSSSSSVSNSQSHDADSLRGEWNQRIACRIAAAAYARLLHLLTLPSFRDSIVWNPEQHPVSTGNSHGLTLSHYYSLFPAGHMRSVGWVSLLIGSMYSMLGSSHHEAWAVYSVNNPNQVGLKLLRRVQLASDGQLSFDDMMSADLQFVAVDKVFFLPSVSENSTKSSGAHIANNTTLRSIDPMILQLGTLLTRKGCLLTDAPQFIFDALSLYAESARQLCPEVLRNWVRGLPAIERSKWVSSWTEDESFCMVQYMVSNLLSGTTASLEKCKAELAGVAFLPVNCNPIRPDSRCAAINVSGSSNVVVENRLCLLCPSFDDATTKILIEPTEFIDSNNSANSSLGRQLFHILTGEVPLHAIRALTDGTTSLVELLSCNQTAGTIVHHVPASSAGIYLLSNSSCMLLQPLMRSLGLTSLSIVVFTDAISRLIQDASRGPHIWDVIEFVWKYILFESLHSRLRQASASKATASKADLPASLKIMAAVPLIPSNSGKIYCLNDISNMVSIPVSVSSQSTSLPSSSSDTGISRDRQQHQLEGGASDNSIVNILELLNIPIVHARFVPYIHSTFANIASPEWSLNTLAAPDIVKILAKVPRSQWELFSISEHHKLNLLKYVSSWLVASSPISEEYQLVLDRLSILPLFLSEYHNWVALQSADSSSVKKCWFMLPDFDSMSISHIQQADSQQSNFLQRPPVELVQLYGILGIEAQPREQFYASYIFPKLKWRSLSTDDRQQHLLEIKRNYDSISDKTVILQDTVAENSRSVDLRDILVRLYGCKDSIVASIKQSKSSLQTMKFGDFLSKIPIFWFDQETSSLQESINHNGADTRWLSGVELVDRDTEFLAYFYPTRVAPKRFSSTVTLRREWSKFLEKLGMTTTVTPQFIMQCAVEVNEKYLQYEKLSTSPTGSHGDVSGQLSGLLTSARIVCHHVLTNWKEIAMHLANASGEALSYSRGFGSLSDLETNENAKQWFSAFSKLHVAPVWREIPDYFQDVISIKYFRKLAPFCESLLCTSEILCKLYFLSSWSQRYVIEDVTDNLNESLVRLLHAQAVPKLQELLSHLLLLCRYQNDLQLFSIYFESVNVASNSADHQSKLPMASLYSHIFATLGSLEFLARDESNHAIIYSKLFGLSFIPLPQVKSDDELMLVEPKQVFLAVDSNIPPYGYSIYSIPILHQSPYLQRALRLRNKPELEDVLTWFQIFAQMHSDEILNPSILDDIISLAELAVMLIKQDPQSAYNEELVYLPDAGCRLQRVTSNLFYDNAAYLKEAVDYSKINFIHPSLSQATAHHLGVRALSAGVVEAVRREDIEVASQAKIRTTMPPDLVSDISKWDENIRSSAYQAALRQVLAHNIKQKSANKSVEAESKKQVPLTENSRFSEEDLYNRLWQLSSCSIRIASKIKSRYLLYTTESLLSGGRGIDVTRANCSKQPLAVMTNTNSLLDVSPVLYILYDPNIIEPSSNRRRNIVAMWKKRWMPHLAFAINSYFGTVIADQIIVSNLLDCESGDDMIELLDDSRISAPPRDISLGTKMLISRDNREKFQNNISVTEITRDAIVYYQDESGSSMVKGQIVGSFMKSSPGSAPSTWMTVSVNPEGEMQEFPLQSLYVFHQNNVSKRSLEMEAAADSIASQLGRQSTAVDKTIFDSKEAEVSSGPTIERTLYKPKDENWAEKELLLLSELQLRQQKIEQQPLEPEPVGVDSFLLLSPGTTNQFSEPNGSKELKQVQVGMQTRKGFNLVRVGNFHEDPNAAIPDIAFFHHLPTLESEFNSTRELLVRRCCSVLRDVSAVFKFEPAMVTLFYEVGATSRFIRQKLMFNLAPIDIYCRDNHIEDLRQHPFPYTYFFGLFVHKLAHFFDVVHGTRHDFFCTEYRSIFQLDWIELLERKGFDVDTIHAADYAKGHLWEIVF